jgi:hypothetical protein
LNGLPLSRFAYNIGASGKEENVRIPSWSLESVAFLCIDINVDGIVRRTPVGTAFRIGFTDEERSDQIWPYFVTARHCIEESSQDTIYVRINNEYRGELGYVDIPTRRDEWLIHGGADVAAIFLPLPSSERKGITYKITFVPLEVFVDFDIYKGYPLPEELIAKTGGIRLGIGDDVFFTGLFVQRPGREQNLPIMRAGTLSRMPIEPIRFRRRGSSFFDAQAYLVEARSWGGHSGSPAFWAYPVTNLSKLPSGELASMQTWLVGLLGLVSGHDDILQEAEREGDFGNFEGRIITKANSGIAIITPATAIKELLMRPDFEEDRKLRREKAKTNEPLPTLDSDLSQDESTAFSKNDFEDALRRASRKTSEPES